jgi:homoserine kinase
MVAETTAAFLAATGLAPEGFAFRIDGEVPPARGLGSSVTVIAGVLAGLNVLRGTGLSRERLVALATELEGHPDNASAGILGGFCVSRCDPATGAYLDTIRVVIPTDLIFVVVSPESEMLTKAARGVLPASLPYFDAAFATGQFDRLRHAVADFMHEPYRLPAIPGARAAIDAGCAAGALTGWLSGSGSSVLCVCRRVDVASVSAAMSAAFTQAGLPSVARALTADNEGLRIE